jgi:hypothetical protein
MHVFVKQLLDNIILELLVQIQVDQYEIQLHDVVVMDLNLHMVYFHDLVWLP